MKNGNTNWKMVSTTIAALTILTSVYVSVENAMASSVDQDLLAILKCARAIVETPSVRANDLQTAADLLSQTKESYYRKEFSAFGDLASQCKRSLADFRKAPKQAGPEASEIQFKATPEISEFVHALMSQRAHCIRAGLTGSAAIGIGLGVNVDGRVCTTKTGKIYALIDPNILTIEKGVGAAIMGFAGRNLRARTNERGFRSEAIVVGWAKDLDDFYSNSEDPFTGYGVGLGVTEAVESFDALVIPLGTNANIMKNSFLYGEYHFYE